MTTARPRDLKIAFVGWNPFQFLHFEKLAAEFDNSTFVLEAKNSADKIFDFQSVLAAPHEILRCNRNQMRELDGRFDVIVCQTPFAGIEEIRASKIAMLQYGYAKEAHNFAPWRSFADVCMTFGHYASHKIKPFCTSVSTGNLRYEQWGDAGFQQQAKKKYSTRLDPAKKTVLFAPTWGPLSSYEEYADAVLALSGEFNVILKIHHNSQRSGNKLLEPIRRKFGVLYGADDDIVELLAVSDVLLSDYSGAIFDAIYCRVPVVLLNLSPAVEADDFKSDLHSIERARRSEIGEAIDSGAALAGAVRRAVNQDLSGKPENAALREQLFVDSQGSSRHAAKVIRDLANGVFHQSQSQQYIRREMIALYRSQSEFALLRKIRRFLINIGRSPSS